MYYNYSFVGMNMIWWFIWAALLFWIFALPYDIPGQRNRKPSPLNILQQRFASGQITKEEYLETKKTLADGYGK